MFQGYLKAVTFSYDDGVTQDKRLIDLFNKYGLKATFNINSMLLDTKGALSHNEKQVSHNKISKTELKALYKAHEVAVHTLTHPLLPTLSDEEIIYQVETDRQNLSQLCEYEVVGMAYPGGGVNFNSHVAQVIENNTGVKYARTTVPTEGFDLQTQLFTFNPTVHHKNTDKCLELIDNFIKLETDSPKLLYIWGHSYEFDMFDNWDFAEEMCKRISNKKDIFYGTNRECLID